MFNVEGVSNALQDNAIIDFISENPLKSAAIATTGAVLASGAVALAVRKKKSKKRTKKSSRKTRTRRKSKKTRRRHTPRTAGKGKDRSTKRIRYTKNGQPYVITRSGKAKFIKKTSAKRSRKLKGGRY